LAANRRLGEAQGIGSPRANQGNSLLASRRGLRRITSACGGGLFCLFGLNGTLGCGAPKAAPAPVVAKRDLDETDRLIDSLLSDMQTAESAKAKPAQGPPTSPLPPDSDSFDADRDRIRASVSKWEHGTGVTLRFLKEATGDRLSLIFVDEAAPEFETDTSTWMIRAKARVTGGKIVGHFVLFLKELRAGKVRGDDHTRDAVMAVLMGEPHWDGRNPETAWSVNRESWCELELHATDGGFEGSFKARLVDNRGSGFINIESGYLFIKR
jgi:hypothetical protein